jgi:hypothetical protein
VYAIGGGIRTDAREICVESETPSRPPPPRTSGEEAGSSPGAERRGRLGGGVPLQTISRRYSYRSAWIGETFVARSAGYNPDSTPTVSDTPMASPIDVTVTTVGHFA